MTTSIKVSAWAPGVLGILRIVTGLLFMQHGFQKLFEFPDAGHNPGPFVLISLVGVAGILETFGGAAIVLGLFTRPVAFVLSGEMAVAYFLFHFANGLNRPRGIFPVVNGGDLAILFCFVFLYFVAAGPGRFSVDHLRAARSDADRV